MSLNGLSFAPVWFEEDHRWRIYYEDGPLPRVSGIEHSRESLDERDVPVRSSGLWQRSLSRDDPDPLRDPQSLASFEVTNE